MARGRTTLQIDELVRLSAYGLAVKVAPRLTRHHVLKVTTRVPAKVYGRPAYAVVCGDETFVVWASHVKLLRPRKRWREPIEDEKETT